MARIRNVVSSLMMEGTGLEFSRARKVLESRQPTTDDEALTLRMLDRYNWIHTTTPSSLPDPDMDCLVELHGEIFQGQDDY